ncbi:hypothetical protein TRIATDRAFT_39972 [Trichoderma atroviride IMI 206040]|uniref:Uncharacterized protein n=1 Tax=Hypocrea atroviridis (strain ATCC 20476 / IMI 206040) TaxID=452589 RepID=G9NU75_HYPAI|nr:uncharacterized protein TRIATDRAFT_39972 [Trichoderma atroviride IMI 206040]EHK45608.1 hypothetical protein TRIATDRAFT_39972 [Trichoderma atroviride IMI 206040]
MVTPRPEDQGPSTALLPGDIYDFLSALDRRRARYFATGSSEPVRMDPFRNSHAPSSASRETRRSSACSSIFDSARSLSSMSSVSSGPQLPCEFAEYYYCEETFDLNNIDDWVQHICGHHLTWRLPKDCVCWFCDAVVFHAVDDTADERERNFRARMHHIAQHFGHGATISDIRPDFYLLEHLRDTGLITERGFRILKDWHEAPQPKGGINSEEPAPRAYDRGVAVEVRYRRGRERWQMVRQQ